MLLLWKRRFNRITFCESSTQAREILARMQHVLGTYQPPSWLVTGILQTVSTEVTFSPKLNFRRERIYLEEMCKREGSSCCPPVVPDGVVSLDWLDTEAGDSPIAVIIPGLTGDSSSGFVRRVAKYLWRSKGFRVACYNPRGRGGNEVVSPFLYSAGYTEDIRRVIAHIRKAYPKNDLFAAGYSLGSNYLAKYIGEEGSNCELAGAVCLACPVDCLGISKSLKESFVGRKFVTPALVSNLQGVRDTVERQLELDEKFDLELIRQAKTIRDFDDAAIAPMFDFSCASDYYRYSSSGLFLHRIQTPVLFLHADNDPIIPGSEIHMDNFTRNPFLINCMTSEGGHSMDWPLGGKLRSWSAQVVADYFKAVLSTKG